MQQHISLFVFLRGRREGQPLRKKHMNERKIIMNNTPNQAISEKAIFSLFSGDNPEIVANPFALLAQMRSTSAVMAIPFPIAGMDRKAWMVTRMEEAVQVLKD